MALFLHFNVETAVKDGFAHSSFYDSRNTFNGKKEKKKNIDFFLRADVLYLVVFNGMTLRHCFANYFIYIAV